MANRWQKMELMLLHIPEAQVAALKELAAGEGMAGCMVAFAVRRGWWRSGGSGGSGMAVWSLAGWCAADFPAPAPAVRWLALIN